MPLHRLTLPVTPFQQNCSLVWCERTRAAALIDPGGEVARLRAAVAARDLDLQAVWLTHAHIDHAGGAGQLAQEAGVPVIGPQRGDAFWIDGLEQQAQMFGFPPALPFTPARWLEDGDELRLGDETLGVRHCPGHTAGHVVFHHAASGVAFVGDVLFAGSVGRSDLPGGDHEQLVDSIRSRLWPLGDATVFVPGHGPESTFGAERRHNPFVRDGV